jgi:predicted NUDIX family phosphoesterase
MYNEITDVNEIVKIRDSFELSDINWGEADKHLRKLLKKKYADEEVLCIKAQFLPSYIKNAYTSANEVVSERKSYDLVADLARVSEFIPRSHAEYNPLYKQLILYVVVRHANSIYVMRRLSGSGEARLVGNASIGVGGHINPIDNDSGNDVIKKGLYREIEEEIKIDTAKSFIVFKGFLYDPSNAVGLDHFGLVFHLITKDSSVSTNEPDKLSGEFIDFEGIKKLVPEMENWSKIIINGLDDVYN